MQESKQEFTKVFSLGRNSKKSARCVKSQYVSMKSYINEIGQRRNMAKRLSEVSLVNKIVRAALLNES